MPDIMPFVQGSRINLLSKFRDCSVAAPGSENGSFWTEVAKLIVLEVTMITWLLFSWENAHMHEFLSPTWIRYFGKSHKNSTNSFSDDTKPKSEILKLLRADYLHAYNRHPKLLYLILTLSKFTSLSCFKDNSSTNCSTKSPSNFTLIHFRLWF